MVISMDYHETHNVSVNGSYPTYYSGPGEDMWNHVIEEYKKSQFTLNEATTIILMVLYVPIFITSLVGNVLVLLVIVPNQRMWTVTNNFLVNLALADLLVTVLCMPMTLAGRVYKLWVYGDVLCKMTPYLQGVSVCASTFTITAMSLDRCLAILHPVKFRNLRTKRNVRTLIAVVWIASSMLMMPLLFVNKTKSEVFVDPDIFSNFQITTCVEEWESVSHRRAYDFSLLFIVCLIPAQIVFISYLLMGKRLWVADSRLTENGKPSATRSSDKNSKDAIRATRRRTAKMCIVVSVVFVVCWLPYYTVNIYLEFKRDQGLLDIHYWSLFIGHLHCITNPILYCFMHKTFRYCVKRMLPCWRKSMCQMYSAYGAAAHSRSRNDSVRSRSPRNSLRQSPSSARLPLNQTNAYCSRNTLGSDDSNQSVHLLVPRDRNDAKSAHKQRVCSLPASPSEDSVLSNHHEMSTFRHNEIPVINLQRSESYTEVCNTNQC